VAPLLGVTGCVTDLPQFGPRSKRSDPRSTYYRQPVTTLVRTLEVPDIAAYVRMRAALWPDADVAGLADEAQAMLTKSRSARLRG
jgi:hypothetical protein